MKNIINKNVGELGRMISSYKKCPNGHICVWNGNIVVDGKKIWYGDLDLTADSKGLQKAANEIGKPLYILREMSARFDNEENPLLEEAVTIIEPKP
ncbi:MAG TPA: hypothetical protein VMV86_04465 [Methanosarcinales archaeon]|nr:hypothetical protein [Methanosarcinales archaeon]